MAMDIMCNACCIDGLFRSIRHENQQDYSFLILTFMLLLLLSSIIGNYGQAQTV
jgi:hypothetical protein